MTAMASHQEHVLTRAAVSLRAQVSGLVGVPLWSMGATETGATLVELTRLSAQVAELELAADLDAKALRVLGRRILGVIAPEVAEAHEARLLEAEERAARESARFTMSDDGHGRVHGRFTLPAAQGAMRCKALLGFAAPKHRAAADGTAGTRRPSPERLGRALMEHVERFPAGKLPSSGGVNATIVVTMDLSTLLDGIGVASLDTGETITASQARGLACAAGIIHAVLGGKSHALDLGRTRRFHTRAQRIAMSLRDQGCIVDGCDTPPGLCHAHHVYARDPTNELIRLPGGKVAFTRRT